MQNVKLKCVVYIILNILSYILLTVACILIFIQTIINMKYNYSNNKTILAEKLVYQEFSHDVYSNINNKILYDLEVVSYDNECPDDKEVLKFPIKLESFFDCENINDDILDEDICQNKISSNLIYCEKDYCEYNIYIKQKICKLKKYSYGDYYSYYSDIRYYKCKYFNIYNGKFSKLFDSKICAKRYEYNYEQLLYFNENNNCKNENCKTFDSKNHCICNNIFNNNLLILNFSPYQYLKINQIIVKNIFSEIDPSYFEYETILKESILNNKLKVNKEEQENVNMYKVINIKNIYEAFFKGNRDIYQYGNYYYYNHYSFLLEDLLKFNNEYVFEKFSDNEFMKQTHINWYTRNYIGFKNINELKKFKKYFDENDPMNNPLYKITEIIYPNWESIIVLILFLILIIFSFIFKVYNFIKSKKIEIQKLFAFDTIRQIISFSSLIVYLFLFLFIYIIKFPKINIDMEIYYEIVLQKYNSRREQKYLFKGNIILGINFVVEIINYIIIKIKDRRNGINIKSSYSITCTLKNSFNQESHKFKFYLKRKFNEEMKRFKEKFFENFDIDYCVLENKTIINDNKIIDMNLTSNSIIEVICEEK